MELIRFRIVRDAARRRADGPSPDDRSRAGVDGQDGPGATQGDVNAPRAVLDDAPGLVPLHERDGRGDLARR